MPAPGPITAEGGLEKKIGYSGTSLPPTEPASKPLPPNSAACS